MFLRFPEARGADRARGQLKSFFREADDVSFKVVQLFFQCFLLSEIPTASAESSIVRIFSHPLQRGKILFLQRGELFLTCSIVLIYYL
jgi:hypothetical protein